MRSISALVDQLAPNGVEFHPLEGITRIASDRISTAELDASNYVGVDNLLPNFGGRKDSSYGANSSGAIRFQAGDVLIGNIRPYLKKVWLADRAGGASPDVLTISILPEWKEELVPKYVYYLLASDAFINYSSQHARGGKMPRGDKALIMQYVVPVPPRAVQLEIVRILDLFSGLESELQAELAARRRQFVYYRASLLSFSDPATAWSTMGEISSRVSSGGTPLVSRGDYHDDGTIPWLRTQEVRFVDIWDTEMKITEKAVKETSAKWIPANCVIVAISGATAGRSAVNKIPLATNQHCCNFEIDPQKAYYRYVFHWIAAHYEDIKAMGQGARSDLNAGLIKSVAIALPDVDEQVRIADALDGFDRLISDPDSGIPAELGARRRQFEVYRNQLMSFSEVTN